MFDLVKYPRIADGPATNHYTINSILISVFQCLLWSVNVSIAEDWNIHARILFYFGNQRPIGSTLIHLRTRASVNGQRFDADVLQPLSHFHYIFRVIIPAQSGLYRYRKVSAFHNLFGHLHHFWNVLKQSCSGTAARDSFHRATIVNVNQIRVHFRCDLCRLYHVANVATKKLDADWPLVFKNIKLLTAFSCITDKTF